MPWWAWLLIGMGLGAIVLYILIVVYLTRQSWHL